MDESRGPPPEPESPRFRWRYILLVIIATGLMIWGLAYMSGGQRGIWGASHTPGAHH